jgi:hypothetical protein
MNFLFLFANSYNPWKFFQDEFQEQKSFSMDVPEEFSMQINEKDIHFFEQKTFYELFWELWHSKHYLLPEEKDLNFLFQLVSPRRKFLTRNTKDERLVLLAVKVPGTHPKFELNSIAFAEKYKWEVLKTVPFHSPNAKDELLARIHAMDPMECPGFFVTDVLQRRQVHPSSLSIFIFILC